VAEPIRIELETEAEGRELIDTLARHGLVGRLLYTEGCFEVELHSPREETRRLLLELEAALGLWLADRGRVSVPLHVGARSRETGEKGGIHGNDRQMESVA